MLIINHIYKIPFQETFYYKYGKQNKLVDTILYEDPITRQIPHIIDMLNRLPDSRQAQIVLPDRATMDRNCMTSMQFQIYQETLYITANFRSQHHTYGMPSDSILIKYVTTQILVELEGTIKDVDITCNVANYHDYKI